MKMTSYKLIAVILIAVSTLTADTLRDKDTGAIVAKGKGGEIKDGKIYWTNCDDTNQVFENADKYIITHANDCHPGPANQPPGELSNIVTDSGVKTSKLNLLLITGLLKTF
jgi:hypothetical protein